MAKKRNAKRQGRRRRKVRRRRAAARWPQAFRIVPVRVPKKPKPHVHMLGQAGQYPCPPGTTYYRTITIDSLNYCVYLDDGGASFMIQC